LRSADDCAPRPGSCRKPGGAVYVNSGKEFSSLPLLFSGQRAQPSPQLAPSARSGARAARRRPAAGSGDPAQRRRDAPIRRRRRREHNATGQRQHPCHHRGGGPLRRASLALRHDVRDATAGRPHPLTRFRDRRSVIRPGIVKSLWSSVVGCRMRRQCGARRCNKKAQKNLAWRSDERRSQKVLHAGSADGLAKVS
jgi:hypothetical protein